MDLCRGRRPGFTRSDFLAGRSAIRRRSGGNLSRHVRVAQAGRLLLPLDRIGGGRPVAIWNGHWAYSDWEWRMVRGRREWIINREPLSAHLEYAKKVGFDVLLLGQNHGSGGLGIEALSQRFQVLSAEDVRTHGASVHFVKP